MGPSIKNVNNCFWSFDSPLPHVGSFFTLIRRQILTKFWPVPPISITDVFMATISLGQGTMSEKFSRISVTNKFSDFQKNL